ncbi:hypothetical protein KW797_03245 [Candidatus Parcubacteria bacterium]|nr:hypothetical protein [Candidatus Parcubacteria bacterium]
MGLIKKKGSSSSSSSSPKKGGFQYKPRSAEQVRERMSRNVGGRDSIWRQGIELFSPRKGDNTVRFMPPPPDADWGHYGFNVVVHYGIGADESAFLCLDKMKGENCPICKQRNEAQAAGEDELADSLKPGFRVAVWVIDRAQEGKGPMLWSMPAGLDKDITKLCYDPEDGSTINPDDPEDGYDFSFTKEGEQKKTKYGGLRFARKSSPLTDDEDDMQKWLEFVVENPIDSLLEFKSEEYIEKAMEGQAAPSDDKEDKKVERKKIAKRGEAEEEEKPARKKIAKRGEAEEEEEEEKPAKKKKKADDDLPTWEQLEELDEDGLAGLGEEMELEFPEEGFDDIDELREFIAQRLGVEIPEAEEKAEEEEEAPKKKGKVEAPAKSNWRDKLKKMSGKK